ncbi:ABC transporter [Hamiltosporidium tvaerminnensis]|uniref:ABC transporter n=1 Tax=Hamiltosporidium tvaerminnensis TaxID=1176355 RepID=A0A4Q9LWJ2_9MICR|nr:ABC transporter [Hamiltosporidium tvaerminnensis]
MNLEWKNVDIELVNKNKNVKGEYVRLINNSSGNVKAGSLCAIMGPSGSGKTTLLKALTGRIPSGSKTRGKILVDGKQRKYETWSKNIGYVDQDDCIFENLTVFETISYAAQFRLKDKNIDIKEKTENLLEELEISDISGSKMISVSGGERKRVMIAIELVTDPKILFLDEPTSGLDSSTSFNLLRLLKDLSKSHNTTIIFTIHQPSVEIFNTFNQLILLSDSHTVYSDEAQKAQEYFESYGLKKRELSTFPDFLSEILKVKKKYKELPENQAIIAKMVNDNQKNFSQTDAGSFSSSNTLAVEIRPSLGHIYILFKRRCKLYLTFKKIFITLVIFAALTFIYIYFSKLMIGEVPKLLDAIKFILSVAKKVDNMPILETSSRELLAKFDIIKDVLGCIICASFLSILFGYYMIPSTGAFGYEYNITKREIGVATYSIGSYYSSVFIFEFLIYLPLLICSSICAKIFISEAIKWETYFFILGALIGYLPTILFFGSCTTRTKTIYAVLSCLAFTWAVPGYFFAVLNFVAIKTENILARIILLLISIFPPVQYNCLLIGITYKIKSAACKGLQADSKLKNSFDFFAKMFYSLIFESLEVWQACLIFIFSTLVFISISILALGLRLKPEMRYKISK